ncbi:2-hydroxyacid dehydrogenase [Agaribacter flavus]|uniref:2-hydroxyacid dehydrogenase n=1 Tax=Agaribacter flavus TaxID=1902781 RepID=A0ABV7FKD5_9ALTE
MNSPIPLITNFNTREQTRYLSLLRQSLPNEKIVDGATLSDSEKPKCELAIVANPDKNALASYTSLKWVHSLWAGIEGLLRDTANSGLKIVRLIDPTLAEVMSESVLTWTLFLHRNMHIYAKQQSDRNWQSIAHCLAKNRTVGVLGLGELGKSSALRLADNGFKVLGWSRTQQSIANIGCLSGESGLNTLLKQSHIIICLLPLTKETFHLLNADRLSMPAQSSTLINFSRGAVVDTQALISALNKDKLAYAVLDVFEQEPLPPSSELWMHPKVTVLPHISAPTLPESACEIVAKNIRAYRQDGTLPSYVDITKGY